MYIQETGPEDAPSIVFLHGGGAAGWSWRYQVEALCDEFHCLVPDLPGNGKSIGEGPFRFSAARQAVADLIRERAHGGRAHVVGLSLGGQLTALLLASDPGLLQSAILSGTLVREVPGLGWLRTGWGRGLLRATLAAYWPVRNQTFWIRANMKSYQIPLEFEPEMREETRNMSIDGFMEMVGNENLGFRLPEGLEKADLPVLVAVGQKEYGVMHHSACDLAEALPNARAVTAQGVGHNWSLEAPQVFTRMVRAWVTRQALPPELHPLPSRER